MRVALVVIQDHPEEGEKLFAFYCTEEDSIQIKKTVREVEKTGDKFIGFCFVNNDVYLLTNEPAYGVIALALDEIVVHEELKLFLSKQSAGTSIPISLIAPLLDAYLKAEMKPRVSRIFSSVNTFFQNVKKVELPRVQFVDYPELLFSDPDNKINILSNEDSEAIRKELIGIVYLGIIAQGLSRLIILDYWPDTRSFAIAYKNAKGIERIIGPFAIPSNALNEPKDFIIRNFSGLMAGAANQCLMHEELQVFQKLNRHILKGLIKQLFSMPYVNAFMTLTIHYQDTHEEVRIHVEGGEQSFFKRPKPTPMQFQDFQNNNNSSGPMSNSNV